MFVCQDCLKEYSVKPDFCDCGNNIFNEVEVAAVIENVEKVKGQTFLDQYPYLEKSMESLDVLSCIIFIALLILSIVSWFVIGNYGTAGSLLAKHVSHNNVKQNKPSVDINSLWDDTQPKPVVQKIANSTSEPVIQEEPQNNQNESEPQPEQNVQESIPKPNIVINKTHDNLSAPVLPMIKKTVSVIQNNTASEPSYNAPKVEESLDHYLDRLRRMIDSNWDREALSGGWVVIQFRISKDGNLYNINIRNSSGYAPLEQSAMHAIYMSRHFDPPPSTYNGGYLPQAFEMDR